MAWYNEPRRHGLAARGIKTAVNGKPIAYKHPVPPDSHDKYLIKFSDGTTKETDRFDIVATLGRTGQLRENADGTITYQGTSYSFVAYPVPNDDELSPEAVAIVKPEYEKMKKFIADKDKELIYSRNTWTESDVRLIKRRLESGKLTKDELYRKKPSLYEGEGVALTPEQTKKGLDWLKKQHYTKSGAVKENTPFGTQEKQIFDDPKATAKVIDFVDRNGAYFPVYEVQGNGDTMEYYVEGGKIHITG